MVPSVPDECDITVFLLVYCLFLLLYLFLIVLLLWVLQDYNSDWVFGLQTSDGSQQLTIKNNESSQQSVIECDLSNDSTYSRVNDNSSSDNSNMYTYISLPNDSPLVNFNHHETTVVKKVDFDGWNNKNVPEPKKVVSKIVTKPVITKIERSPPVKKTFVCPVCNKIFASKSNLERHGVVHSDVKPFQCVECKKMFSRRVHLERHKFLHMDQKPFNCEICKKGFTQKTHMLKHQYVHTGVKPFPCNLCEKTFARKESLNRHKLVIHGVKVIPTDSRRTKFNKSTTPVVNENNIVKKEIPGDADSTEIINNVSIESIIKIEKQDEEKQLKKDVEKKNDTEIKCTAIVIKEEEIDIDEGTNNIEKIKVESSE